MVEGNQSTANTPFTWRGQELRTIGQIKGMMSEVTKPAEAQSFTTAFRESLGTPDADVTIFQIAAYTGKAASMRETLGRFLQGDFSGDFFITEAPGDEYGNTANKPCVRRVRIAEDSTGYPQLNVLEPAEIAKEWPSISPTAWRYFVVDGPARMLNTEEWARLVGFERPTR